MLGFDVVGAEPLGAFVAYAYVVVPAFPAYQFTANLTSVVLVSASVYPTVAFEANVAAGMSSVVSVYPAVTFVANITPSEA